jgi:EAL and modified HD-GYP domain-containing signal transduction protein
MNAMEKPQRGSMRMAAQAGLVKSALALQPEFSGEMRYVARQPILDLQGRVHAYDLHFRNAPEVILRRDAELAVQTMLDNEVIFGLERLTNGLPAFITCTAQALTGNSVLVLSPGLTVLGVPSGLDPEPRLIEACRALKARGFRLALDDFAWSEHPHPLLNQADYLRLEFNRLREAERQQVFKEASSSLVMVAQKVATYEDHRKASALGFTLFQGDYFCHPVLLKKRKAPANSRSHFEIVRELYHEPIDIRKVGQLVRRDAALTYRLLRLVNSPVYGIYQEVRSIEAAITVLGEATFRRVVSLAVLSELNGEQPSEILHIALVRARFCELAARCFGQDADEQYLLGMLSLLPAMLGVPMEEIVPILPLRGQICEALAGTANSERRLLGWLEAHEHADWGSCDRIVATHDLNSDQLAACYVEAVSWAEQPAAA